MTTRVYLISDTHGADFDLARLTSAIIDDLKRHPDAIPLLVHSGDYVGANKLLSSFKDEKHKTGDFDADVFQAIVAAIRENTSKKVYVVFTPGNHDVLYGTEALEKFIQQTECTAVVSNASVIKIDSVVKDADAKEKKAREFLQSQLVSSAKIEDLGILGLMTQETLSSPGNMFQVDDGMAAIEERIKELKLKGVKNFIIVSHLGLEPDIILAQKLLALGIDNCVILGGHSHTLTEKPVVITQDGRTVTVFNGGARAENCIAVDLDVIEGKLRLGKETLLSSQEHKLDSADKAKTTIAVGKIVCDYLRERPGLYSEVTEKFGERITANSGYEGQREEKSKLDKLGGSAREKASAFFADCKKDPNLFVDILKSSMASTLSTSP